MVSEKEIEAAIKAFQMAHTAKVDIPLEQSMRDALEASARVRAEDNAEGGEPEGELCKCAPAFHEHDEAGAKHCRSCDAEWHPAPQPSGPVKALADALRGLLKAYENAFDWSAELPPETAEAERIANEVLQALTSSKPEQHQDDEAVDRFAAAMKAKLKWEREERGRYGWNDPEVCSEEYLAQLLIEHLAKGNDGNFEDVANFCMMLHQRGAHPRVLADALTAGKPQPSVKVKPLEWVASDDWEYRWTADLYAIEDQGKNWSTDRYWLYYNGQRLGKFGTFDAASFAAQADYERRILSALTAGKPEQVPSGWKLVPEEPTEEMYRAVYKVQDDCAIHNYGASPTFDDYWSAALSASPTPPTAGGGDA